MTATPSTRTATHTIAGVLIAMALIESLSGITQGYVNPILPALGNELAIDDPTINFIFLISQLGFAVLTPIISRLGDSYGYRPVLRISVVVVAAGVFLMALYPTLWTVTIGVVLITCVVGFIPLMMGILRISSSGDTRRGVSVMIGILMITIGLGGLLAGLVGINTPSLGFWVAVPFACLALVCAFLIPDAGTPTREPLALTPLLACSLGLVAFVVAISMAPDWGWDDARTIGSGLAAVVLLGAWIALDSTRTRQFVDLTIFRVPQVRVVSTATFFFGFASVSYLSTNGIFLYADASTSGYGFGLNSLQIAALFIVVSVFSLVSSLLTNRLLTIIGEKATLIMAGLVLAAAFAAMATLHHTLLGYCVGLALFGLGMGTYQSATRALSVEGVEPTKTATAAGVNELALSVGIAVGAAVVKLLSTVFVAAGHTTLTGLTTIWIALGAAGLISAGVSAFYPRKLPLAESASDRMETV